MFGATEQKPSSPITIDCTKSICIKSEIGQGQNQPVNTNGNQYMEIANGALQFKESESNNLKNKMIVLQNGDSGNRWYSGITGATEDTKLVLQARESDLVLDSLSAKGVEISQGATIDVRDLHIGSGREGHTDILSSFAGMSGKKPASVSVMQGDRKDGEIRIITKRTIIHKDGVLALNNMSQSQQNFRLTGDLYVLGGGLVIAGMSGASSPNFSVSGKATLENAQIGNVIPTKGEFGRWQVVSADGGIELKGTQKIKGFFSYFMQEYVDVPKDHIDYGYALQRADGEKIPIYGYDLQLEGNTLYASPKLTEAAKDADIVKMIQDTKNEIAIAFYKEAVRKLESCKQNGCSQDGKTPEELIKDYTMSAKGLKDYLDKQVKEGNLQESDFPPLPTLNFYGVGDSESWEIYAQNDRVSTSGLDSIDAKLALIKDGINNDLAEMIKNSSNDLLAVNFVNTLSQAHNDTPIRLINEIKSGFSNSAGQSSLTKSIQENLGAKLSIAQRLSSYSFARVKSVQAQKQAQDTLYKGNTQELFEDSTPSHSPSSNLWFNLLGGTNISGSKVGGSFGANVGYDKALENIVLGGYLSYGYLNSQDLAYSANSHIVEAGMYLRSDFSSHQIDFSLKTQFAMSDLSKTTKALESKSTSNQLNSFTQANVSYGYNFITSSLEAKPYVGISAGFGFTPKVKESGDLNIEFDSQSNFSLGASVGVEIKKYFGENGFFYIIPSIEQSLLDTQKDIKLSIGGSPYRKLPLDSSLKTYAQILIGGEIELSSSWSLGVSLGVKQNIAGNKDEQGKWKNETYLMGNIGGVWRF